MPQYVTTDELHETLTEVNRTLLEEVSGAEIEPAGDNTKLRTREKVRLVSEEIGEAQREIYRTAHTCEEIVTEGVCAKRLPYDLLRKLEWIKTQKGLLKTAIQALGTGMPDNEIFHDYYKWIKGGGGSDPQPDIPEDVWRDQGLPEGKITWATPCKLHMKYSQPTEIKCFARTGNDIGDVVASAVPLEVKSLMRVGYANACLFGFNRSTFDSRLGSIYGIVPKFDIVYQGTSFYPAYGYCYYTPQNGRYWKTNGTAVSFSIRFNYTSHVKGYTHREYTGGQWIYSDEREFTQSFTANGSLTSFVKDGVMYYGYAFVPSQVSSFPSGTTIYQYTGRWTSDITSTIVIGDVEIPGAACQRVNFVNINQASYIMFCFYIQELVVYSPEFPVADYVVFTNNQTSSPVYKCMQDPSNSNVLPPAISGTASMFSTGNTKYGLYQYFKTSVRGSGGKYIKKIRAVSGALTRSDVQSRSELLNGGTLSLDFYWRSYSNLWYETGTFPALDPDYTGNQYIAQECEIEFDFGSEAAPPSVITPDYVGDTSTSRLSSWSTPYTPEADSETRTEQEAEQEAEQQTGEPSTDTVTKILAYAVSKIGTPYPPAAEQANGNRFGPSYYACSTRCSSAVKSPAKSSC